MTLLELQRRMSVDVTRPLTPDFEMQTHAEDGSSLSQLAAGYIKPNLLLSPFERLEIYNRQYWFRVIGAVSEDYPGLNAVLGAKRFDALVLAYLKDNPSMSFTLRELSRNLPQWLLSHAELAGGRLDLAVDVARLEWAYVEGFDGASVTPLTAHEFAGLLPDSSLFLQPHLQLLALRYPVDEIVLAARKNTPETGTASNAVSERKTSPRTRLPKIKRNPVHLAIHRFDHSVYYRRIERENFLLLSAIRNGNSIAEAIGHALEKSKLKPLEQAAKIKAYFAHASELGWLSATPSVLNGA